MTTCKRLAPGEGMKNRVAVVLLLTLALLATPGWTEESSGQEKLPRVGILTFAAFADDPTLTLWFEPFRRTLADQGWIDGKNVSFEFRSAQSDPTRFDEAATELAGLKVDVILAVSAPAVRAAYAATRTIPIVVNDFTSDPVAEGYVESHGRPIGNVTGVFLDAPEITGKWFELLKAMVPGLSRVSVLWDPSPGSTHMQAVHKVAGSSGVKLQILKVRKPDEIDRAFSALRGKPQALIILPSPMIHGQNERIAGLALKSGLPAISMSRAFADAGGVAAYGPQWTPTFESDALLVAKILSGARPGDLPIEHPTKFELVVNLKTAKTLGMTIPQSILLRADEVIR
jgi:putative ABC transport system substrate-binding protein